MSRGDEAEAGRSRVVDQEHPTVALRVADGKHLIIVTAPGRLEMVLTPAQARDLHSRLGHIISAATSTEGE